MSRHHISTPFAEPPVLPGNRIHFLSSVRALTAPVTRLRPPTSLTESAVSALPLKKDPTSFASHYLQDVTPDDALREAQRVFGFAPSMSKPDLKLFHSGHHLKIHDIFGAHFHREGQVNGVRFAVWAPAAQAISVVGEFNHWNDVTHPMLRVTDCGVWEAFIPELHAGLSYKFSMIQADGRRVLKTDPYGLEFEFRPDNAAVITAPSRYTWQDENWVAQRKQRQHDNAPLSIYEVHLGSWQRDENDLFLNYRELAHRLAEYAVTMGFTHIELMPITEHPLDDSWGYQTTGYFAPTSRFGKPDDFRYFVDYLHSQNIGVLLDWVPAHFPRDDHALARFDGTALYEYADPRLGEHIDWGTFIPDFTRNEVRNFFLASALFWLDEFHLDGLRVDAVASMLYRDYSRDENDWVPNIHGGNEHLEVVTFLQELTNTCEQFHPGALIIAEESTAWPGVTAPTETGGLGFSRKWNMGWMHDTLEFMSTPLDNRVTAQNQISFSALYAWSERYVLSFSHDEVVHEKKSLFYKMAGSETEKFANLHLLFTLMFTWPGSKLLFMGNEFAQRNEWCFFKSLVWNTLDDVRNRDLQSTVRTLNRLYRQEGSLHQRDFDPNGFEWIDCENSADPVIAFQRNGHEGFSLVVLNFGGRTLPTYRLGVPQAGNYDVIFLSNPEPDAAANEENIVHAIASEAHGRPFSLEINLPALTGIILKRRED